MEESPRGDVPPAFAAAAGEPVAAGCAVPSAVTPLFGVVIEGYPPSTAFEQARHPSNPPGRQAHV
eukprot:COSAG01_NODE_2830_length_6998_cov_17.705754_9_plen_65_part_00